eukprot:SAG31_NODE_32734_length_352_cov_0.810277_1_plen_51_part_10
MSHFHLVPHRLASNIILGHSLCVLQLFRKRLLECIRAAECITCTSSSGFLC